MERKLSISIFLLSFLLTSFLQAQTLSQHLSKTMEEKRSDTYFSGTLSFENDAISSSKEFAQLLKAYTKDTSVSVRNFTYELYVLLNEKTSDELLKTEIVEQLCMALSDSVQQIRSTAAVALEDVAREQFSEEAKQFITESLSAYGDIDEDQILLIGYLGLDYLSNELHVIKMDPEKENRIRWCAYLALARMGDEASFDFILTTTQKKEINDRVVYNYFPDLIYTRQRKAFDYLIAELHNKTKNCKSPNPNISEEMVCGYRIMEMLAPVVKDFPLETTAAGTIATKNYDQALETTRKWFRKNEQNYIILNDKF